MPDESFTFEPSDMVSKTEVVSDAASKAQSKAGTASAAAASALSKASVASVAAAGVASQASDASSAALVALSKASDASVAAAGVASQASDASSAASDAVSKATVAQSKASDVSSALAARQRVVILKVYNEASAISTGTGKMYFTIPNELNGLDLKSCGAHLYTAGSGVTHITLYNVTSNVDMLTSKIEIDTAEKDSKDASSAAVINTDADGVAVGEEIRVDISTAASAAKGLEVRAAFG